MKRKERVEVCLSLALWQVIIQSDANSMLEVTAMIDLTQGIDSLTNFKRNSAAFMKRMKKSGKPVVLTVNGRAEVVVQDAASYQQLLELIERLETVEGIRQGLEEMKQGKGKPAEEV